MTEILLPATLVPVPSLDYYVRAYKSVRGREGDAYTAQLVRPFGVGVRLVAEIHDDGRGGEVDVQFLDGEFSTGEPNSGRRMVTLGQWASARTSPERDRFLEWCGLFTGKWSVEHNLDWTPEGVVSVLVEEATLTKELNRRRGTSFLLPGDVPAKGYQTLTTGNPDVAARYFVEHYSDGVRIWAKTGWVTA